MYKTEYGDVIFWQQTGSGFGITVVDIDGVTSNITSEYGSTPDCGSSGCAVFNNLETGTYNYSASDGTDSWSGYITISEGCLQWNYIRIHYFIKIKMEIKFYI